MDILNIYIFIFSGCITTAESVLITQQSQEELFKIIQNNKQLMSEGKDKEMKTIIVSISPQSRASIAARYKITIEQVKTHSSSSLFELLPLSSSPSLS